MKKNKPGPNRWKEQAKYWKSVPAGATAIMLGGVFCLFASLGLLIGIINAQAMTIGQALAEALITGGLAIAWATAGFRRIIWLMIVMFPLQFAANAALRMMWAAPVLKEASVTKAEMMSRLRTEGTLAIVMILAGYILVVMFIRKEGLRVFGAMTEVRLASQVHRALVPPFSRRIGDYEICGLSAPSGQVGGDLVDVMEGPARWTAYVADVAGHGISAGMVMAMIKSAVRMGSRDETISKLLFDLNGVILSLAEPNVFATFAGISGTSGSDLTFSLAGHLPILHYRKGLGRVDERTVSNLPLGILPGAEFQAAPVTCAPGDILAIMTDGLTETFNNSDQEVGLGALKTTLLECAGSPLPELIDKLRDTSLTWGKQVDDQTVLLLRRDAL